MLNKELLLATEGQTAGHIKLTVGHVISGYGYHALGDETPVGVVSRIPTWNLKGKPVQMWQLETITYTILYFNGYVPVDASAITMTVVEKDLTVTLVKDTSKLPSYNTTTMVFNSSDVGKTYTIIFDPEPTGYV